MECSGVPTCRLIKDKHGPSTGQEPHLARPQPMPGQSVVELIYPDVMSQLCHPHLVGVALRVHGPTARRRFLRDRPPSPSVDLPSTSEYAPLAGAATRVGGDAATRVDFR